MFIDASAAISILSGEDDAAELVQRLERAEAPLMSPLSLYETIAGLARKRACPVEEAQDLVDQFVAEVGAKIIDISPPVGRMAVGREADRRAAGSARTSRSTAPRTGPPVGPSRSGAAVTFRW